jgi:MFS family permease
LILFAPRPAGPVISIFATTGTTLLYAGFMTLGLSQGLVEGVINPLITTLYSTQKTRRLNLLHAWWPGGLVVGGLVAFVMTRVFHASWELKMAMILVPAAVYLVQALSLQYPQTERVQSKVTTAAMWRESIRPGFILLFCCMWMTAAIEVGPDQWFPSVMGALVPQLQGVLYLVYTSGLVFLLRTLGSGIAHRSPILTLLVGSGLAGLGLYWLGSLHSGVGPAVAFLAATIFGVGKAFLWPTLIGVTAERFPRGGALPDGRSRHGLRCGCPADHGCTHRSLRGGSGVTDDVNFGGNPGADILWAAAEYPQQRRLQAREPRRRTVTGLATICRSVTPALPCKDPGGSLFQF